jgi:hypothetical protein
MNKTGKLKTDEKESLSDEKSDIYYSEDSEDENYVISSKITDALINIPEISYKNIVDYDPPVQHGLSNCNAIIPEYYQLHKHPSRIFKLDYFEIIKDDVRNCRILNEYQMKYIKEVPEECKNELFDIFNECLKVLNDLINST